MEAQKAKLGTKFIIIQVPDDLNPGDITRVKARKNDESQSQEVEFEIQAPMEETKRNEYFSIFHSEKKRVVSAALGKAPEENPDDGTVSVDDQVVVKSSDPEPLLVDSEISGDLLSCWEWDERTGDPILPNPESRWTRHVRHDFVHSAKTNAEVLPNELSEYLESFMAGMRNEKSEFSLRIGTGADSLETRLVEAKFLRRILSHDFKKIKISRRARDKIVTLTITKMEFELLSYHTLPGGEPSLRCTDSNPKTVKQINTNAKYGHYGPGTYWCRRAQCQLRDNVSASAIVDYGREHKFYLKKRFTCCAKNCTYMLHCNECKSEGTYANHCGFTINVHSRMTAHFGTTKTSSTDVALPSAVMRELIRTGQDKIEGQDNIRQDSHYHFGYEHEIGRKAARLTVMDHFPKIDRKTPGKAEAETCLKLIAGSYDYLGLGRGGLNKYGVS